MLHPENPATTQDHQGWGNIGGYARLEALCLASPRRQTATASEALAGTGEVGGHFEKWVTRQGSTDSIEP